MTSHMCGTPIGSGRNCTQTISAGTIRCRAGHYVAGRANARTNGVGAAPVPAPSMAAAAAVAAQLYEGLLAERRSGRIDVTHHTSDVAPRTSRTARVSAAAEFHADRAAMGRFDYDADLAVAYGQPYASHAYSGPPLDAPGPDWSPASAADGTIGYVRTYLDGSAAWLTSTTERSALLRWRNGEQLAAAVGGSTADALSRPLALTA